MRFFRITIAHRLWLLVTMALVSLVAVGLTGLSASRDLSLKLAEVNGATIPKIKTLSDIRYAFEVQQKQLMLHISYTSEEQMEETDKVIAAARKSVATGLKAYEGLASDDFDRKLLEVDKKLLADFDKVFDEAWKQSQELVKMTARTVITENGTPLADAVAVAFDKHIAKIMAQADVEKANGETASRHGLIASTLVIAFSAVVIAGIGFLLIRKIARDLGRMRDTIGKVESELDFTLRLKIDSDDELAYTGRAFNRLIDKMHKSLNMISESVLTVQHSATSLSGMAGQVASAATAQSESASSMAASVEELTVSIGHVGDQAVEADRLASESGRLAQSGEQVIAQTVSDISDIADAVNASADRIGKLEQASQSISRVVQVIKDVAEQTNLLALNAAIEAARAGEQGRGFAVVADEVRKLAERTASSTNEISSTIELMRESARLAVDSMQEAVGRVGLGVAHANNASLAIREIGAGGLKTVAMAGAIANAIHEQSQSSAQIARMVERIAQMAEESTVVAQGSATSAEQLDRLATQMQGIITAYRLN
ncbi:MAG: methyl-accepting chemotaxis protein [Proteobacteria bacterium]|nr:methyl-accepting chemotaxis protein [Pseudomonadota bacterium]